VGRRVDEVRSESLPGASAQQMADRMRAEYRHRTRNRHPHIGGFLLAIRDEPQDIQNWAKGADGERRLGRALNDLAEGSAHVRVLHDRRRPRSTANIDHIVVAPRGVFVIDTKFYKGRVANRDRASFLRARPTLAVGGWDRTNLVRGALKQAADVRSIVGADVPIHPVLCFINADWQSWSRRFVIDGVFVTAWKPLRKRLIEAKPPSDGRIDRVATILERELAPAVRVSGKSSLT
jgi:hypothetical protein